MLTLGAEGVQLGMRFLVTVEANAPEHVRKLILAATDTSTMSAEGRVKPRVSKPEFAMEVLGENKRTQMGQISALINDVKTVEQVMRELVDGGLAAAQASAAALSELAEAQVAV